MSIRRGLLAGAGTILVLVVLGTFVFPTRTFLAQRQSIASAQEQLNALEEQRDALDDQAARLRDDAEIERMAREQFNLVRPGEEAYAVLPPPGTPDPSPEDPVLPPEERSDGNVVQRAWRAFTDLF
jgi:Septum formation initiator